MSLRVYFDISKAHTRTSVCLLLVSVSLPLRLCLPSVSQCIKLFPTAPVLYLSGSRHEDCRLNLQNCKQALNLNCFLLYLCL